MGGLMNNISLLHKQLTTKGIPSYRGIGGVKFSDDFTTDPGDLGKGIYRTTSLAEANAYGAGGTVENSVSKFKNPLIMGEKEAYDLADSYGTLRGTTQQRLAGAEKLTKDLIEKGYDGFVSVGRTSVGEPSDRLQIVDFSPFLKSLGVGTGLMGAASLYSPEAAQARQMQDMAASQALEEPTFDPTTLLAGPARWGGGLMNMIGDTALRYLTK